MKYILVGHRGTGKTQLMQRMKEYSEFAPMSFFDLDEEIETHFARPLTQLFPEVGEKAFREIEIDFFNKLTSVHNNCVISVGAGFPISQIPFDPQTKIIWVRRNTDEFGRIFFNRPKLDSKLSSLEEFKARYPIRQQTYMSHADETYTVPEGLTAPNPTEEKILSFSKNISAQGILTLTSAHIKNNNLSFLRFGCDMYELRDDLIPVNDRILDAIPFPQRLLSFRSKNLVNHNLSLLPRVAQSDWAIELGACPKPEISIISAHDRLPGESLSQFLTRLQNQALPHQHLKASPVIANFKEASELFTWQQKDSTNRSALPRSPATEKGRWMWLRLLLKGRQKINFWRDADGSAPDQPTLFEWLSSPNKPLKFAALLGNPVIHSKTMIEHSKFFELQNAPVWPVLILENEFNEALEFLIDGGLIAAAVTSPLKNLAYLACGDLSDQAKHLKSVNTIKLDQNSCKKVLKGHNTDIDGFKHAVDFAKSLLNDQMDNSSCVVWGGGGTLAAIEEVLPQGIQVSVRGRSPRSPTQIIPKKVQLLVWAAGPGDDPPPDFDFEVLVDLNYREDSQAREWARLKNAKYVSGDVMFKQQALFQKKFWQNS